MLRRTHRDGTRWTLLDVFYEVGVILKGIDGLIELLAGILLIVAPSAPHHALTAVASELSETPTSLRMLLAGYLESLDDKLIQSGLTFLVVFLILHGAVKLALVYFLLRRVHRAYPYALAVLIAFLGYQLYTLIVAPTIGMGVLTALDVVIIVLVYKEYREIRPATS
jgi:Predicted membrane protein